MFVFFCCLSSRGILNLSNKCDCFIRRKKSNENLEATLMTYLDHCGLNQLPERPKDWRQAWNSCIVNNENAVYVMKLQNDIDRNCSKCILTRYVLRYRPVRCLLTGWTPTSSHCRKEPGSRLHPASSTSSHSSVFPAVLWWWISSQSPSPTPAESPLVERPVEDIMN